jgi:N-dimethylarginine dimethylaminohydrolase
MCPPEHFGVLYEINTWMHKEVAVDADLAREQWQTLVATLRGAGAEVELLPAVQGLPDLVFTANAGIVNGDQFVPARFRHPERQGETPYDIEWFATRNYEIDELPLGVSHEGAGDALPFGNVLLSGYRTRSDAASHAYLSKVTGAAVRPIELVDERLYHLDLTFCPLDDQHAMVAPIGWDSYGRKVVDALVPELLVLDDDATYKFCANSVVVGRTVVMPECPPDVGRQLEAWGFDVAVVDVSEFQKAGGACRCLTLALDVQLASILPR